jgi:hypothetical protein
MKADELFLVQHARFYSIGGGVTLKEVIDAQASKDQPRAYMAVRTAAGHMQQIADPLAEAIVKQFPDKFGG